MTILTIALDESRVSRNGVIMLYPQGLNKDGNPGFRIDAQLFDVTDTGKPFLLARTAKSSESVGVIYSKFFPGEKNPFDESGSPLGKQIPFPVPAAENPAEAPADPAPQ